MNLLTLVLALSSAFGQAQPHWIIRRNIDLKSGEPVDVPAIQVDTESEMVMRGDAMLCSNGGMFVLGRCANGKQWTCADKSRILLTDESGGKHCVRFN